MRTLQQIADTLQSQLKRRSLTQEGLRRETGISKQTLTNVLSGSHDYKATTLLAVCDRLGLDLLLVPKELGGAVQERPSTPVVKSVVDAALDVIEARAGKAAPDER
jgi:transcriptional regulator with XRE-family HTH domain